MLFGKSLKQNHVMNRKLWGLFCSFCNILQFCIFLICNTKSQYVRSGYNLQKILYPIQNIESKYYNNYYVIVFNANNVFPIILTTSVFFLILTKQNTRSMENWLRGFNICFRVKYQYIPIENKCHTQQFNKPHWTRTMRNRLALLYTPLSVYLPTTRNHTHDIRS